MREITYEARLRDEAAALREESRLLREWSTQSRAEARPLKGQAAEAASLGREARWWSGENARREADPDPPRGQPQ